MATDDVRYRFIRGLQFQARGLNLAEHTNAQLIHVCRGVVHIALHAGPIRSPEDVLRNVRGVGATCVNERLEVMHSTGSPSNASPPCGHFVSAAACILVAAHRWRAEEGGGAGGDHHCPQGELVARASALLDTSGDAAGFLSADDIARGRRCPLWQQTASLVTMAYLKPHADKRRCEALGDPSHCTWELTDEGAARARELEASSEAREAGALRAHRPNAPVLLLVDLREGGGLRRDRFHELTAALARNDAPFETCVLPTGLADYLFVVQPSSGSARYALPLVIERKSLVDVSASLSDGRWDQQQVAMRACGAAMDAGGAGKAQGCARLIYLIEGERPPRPHPCGCGCAADGVGGCARTHASVSRVEAAINALTVDGFELVGTRSLAHTAAWLVSTSAKLTAGVQAGELCGRIDFALPRHLARRLVAAAPAAGSPAPRDADGAGSSAQRERLTQTQLTASAMSGWALKVTKHAAPASGAQAGPPLAQPVSKRARSSAKPQLSWDELETAVRALIGAHALALDGAMPTAKQLEEAGRADLVKAVGKHGGFTAVRARLGLSDDRPYWPGDRTCNFALLVALHASWLRAGARDEQAGALSKDALMAAASVGGLCKTDMFAARGATGCAYDGWGGMSELTTPPPPRQPFVRSAARKVAGQGDRKAYFLTKDFGRERAAHLHAHAELHGWCACGLVQPRQLCLLGRGDGQPPPAHAGTPVLPLPAPVETLAPAGPAAPAAPAAPQAPVAPALFATAALSTRAAPPAVAGARSSPLQGQSSCTDRQADAAQHEPTQCAEPARLPPARPAAPASVTVELSSSPPPRERKREPPRRSAGTAPAARAPSAVRSETIDLCDDDDDDDEAAALAAQRARVPSLAQTNKMMRAHTAGQEDLARPLEHSPPVDTTEREQPLERAEPIALQTPSAGGSERPAARRLPPPVRSGARAPGCVQVTWERWDEASRGCAYAVEWCVSQTAAGPASAWESSAGASALKTISCNKSGLVEGSWVRFHVRPVERGSGAPLAEFSEASEPFEVPCAQPRAEPKHQSFEAKPGAIIYDLTDD